VPGTAAARAAASCVDVETWTIDAVDVVDVVDVLVGLVGLATGRFQVRLWSKWLPAICLQVLLFVAASAVAAAGATVSRTPPTATRASGAR
jgi:hypothetical protein